MARIRQEMEALKQQHAAVVGELQAKLAWYAENQELVSENNDLIQQQAATIQKLERRLELAGAAPGAAKVCGWSMCQRPCTISCRQGDATVLPGRMWSCLPGLGTKVPCGAFVVSIAQPARILTARILTGLALTACCAHAPGIAAHQGAGAAGGGAEEGAGNTAPQLTGSSGARSQACAS